MAVFCAAVIAAGWPWTHVLIGDRMHPVVRVSFGYLIGAALVTLAELGAAFLHIPIVRGTVLACLVGVFAVGLVLARRGRDRDSETVPGPMRWAYALFVPIGVVMAAIAGQAVENGAPDHVDFLRAWGKKGLEVFTDHNLNFAHLGGPHGYYPLEISNLFGSFYLLRGRPDDSVIRVELALFALALVPVMWWMCRRILPPVSSAGAIALAVCLPQFILHASRGQADLAMGVYITITVLACYLWLLDGDDRYAGLAGFAGGAAAWTKLEGAFTAAAILVVVVLVRRSLRSPGLYVALSWFVVFVVPWKLFQRIHHINFNNRHFAKLYLDVPWILRHVTESLTTFSHWGVFWPLTLAVIALTAPLWWRSPFRMLAYLTLPNLIFNLAGFVTQYRAGEANSVTATASRLYLHLAPSVAVMAAAGATLAVAAVLASRRAEPEPATATPPVPEPT